MRSESQGRQDKEMIKQLKKVNYYQVLDLKSGATEADIKKSFKKMALKYHPDKNSASCSKQIFHKITEAYDTLSDPQKRMIYDEKQNSGNKNRMEFTFSRSNSFSQNPFNAYQFYNKAFKRAYEFQAKFNHQKAEFKMNEKAKKERQFFKKQSEQREKQNKREWNQYFKDKGDFKNSNQSKSNPDKKQKSNWSKAFNNFTNQNEFFTFERSNSKKGSSFSTDYEQVRRQYERKQRLKRQKQKADRNIRTFLIFVLIVVAWMVFSHFGPMMRGIPVYSMQPSQTYKIIKFTKELKSPFYVTEQYVERASADDRFRQHLDKKIDIVYIKSLSRVCNTMMKKEQQIYDHLDVVKSKKSRKELNKQLKSLDLSSCDKLHDARESNPVYFKGLFLDQRNKDEL